jgi:hypothetical protein
MAYIFDNVKTFAAENADLASAMKEYAHNVLMERKGDVKAFSAHSKDEMEGLIDKAFAAEIARRSNFALPTDGKNDSMKRYSMNPMVKYFADEIANSMIDMILPDTLMNSSIRYFADFQFADLGDSITWDVKSNALFTVSKADYRKRNTNVQRSFDTTVTMTGTNHMITVADNLFNILVGRAHIASDVMKATISIETQMLFEAYEAFTTAMDKVTGNLLVSNYSEKSLIKLAQTVTAYNNGRKAVILGTPVALKSVLPSNSNYRYLLSDEYVRLGHLQTFNNYDVLPLEQVADPYAEAPYALKLDDSKIYVASPASDKIVKIGVFGGTYTNANDPYDTANKTQNQTLEKAWDVAVVTNSVAGVVKDLEAGV